ncbi:MAG TPA: hypothetical protein VNY78_03445 [Edaphobacter sp.]|nr:hypothetical protein [Edaphobacter sp.]
MRYLMLAPVLLLTNIAFAGDQPASCEIAKLSILDLSSAGLAQVSNLGFIEIRCRVSARPFPDKPDEFRYGLKAVTTAYQISADGTRKEVPSVVNVSGGGFDRERESVNFYLDLPLERAERDLEARKYLDRLQKKAPGAISDSQSKQMLEHISRFVSQHRAGHFRVECRVLDGTRVVGVGVVELEVLFKGRFSDADGFLGYWQAPTSKAEP